jgi:hypothetical protein
MIPTPSGRLLSVATGGAVLLVICGWHSPCWSQVPDLLLDRVNEFPVRASAEVVRSQSQRLTIEFNIYFSLDDERYVPVKPELAKLLSMPPEIRSKPGLRVRTISTECTPRKLTVREKTAIATVVGGVIRCEIEIAPETFLEPGVHEVTLAFESIEVAFIALKTNLSQTRPEAQVKVQVWVWASEGAKQEAQRKAAEEMQRREEANQAAQRAAEAKQQREAELAAQRRREVAMTVLKYSLALLAAAIPVGLVLFTGRKWLWPRLKASVAAGECRQYHRCIPARDEHPDIEPGTILETLWATNWRGHRHRIKVEVFVAEDSPEGEPRHENTAMAAERSEAVRGRWHDVLVAVGASIPRGVYLADCPAGAVRITVTR